MATTNKQEPMKIVKIIERTTTPNEKGEYIIYAQVMMGNIYQYAVLRYNTLRDATRAREGSYVNTERTKIDTRTKNQ